MNSERLYRILEVLADLISPLVDAVENRDTARWLVNELGFEPPALPEAFEILQGPLTTLVDLIDDVDDMYDDEDADDSELLELTFRLLEAVKRTVETVSNLEEAFKAQFEDSDFLATTSFSEVLSRRLIDYLMVNMLNRQFPVVYSTLRLIGLVESTEITETPTEYHVPFSRKVVHWEKIPSVLSDPIGLFRATYKWDSDDIDIPAFLERLQLLAVELGMPADYDNSDCRTDLVFNPHVLNGDNSAFEQDKLRIMDVPILAGTELDSSLNFRIYPLVYEDGSKIDGFALAFHSGGDIDLEIPVNSGLKIQLNLDSRPDSGFGIAIRKAQPAKIYENLFRADVAEVHPTGKLINTMTLVFGNSGSTKVLFGSGEGTRLEVGSLSLNLGFACSEGETPDLFAEFDMRTAKIAIAGGDGDGFLQKILPQEPLVVNFDLTLGISNTRGFYIKGGAGLEYTVVVSKSFGPIFVNTVDLKLDANEDILKLTTAATGRAEIGPAKALVREIGLETRLELGKPGLLGNADLSFGFKPPSGVGLSIDAGPIKMDGLLVLDPPNYLGLLQVSVKDTLSVSALAIITTRLPDGKSGYALFGLFTAEFKTCIPIGLGFAICGFGGMFALNRSMCEEGLRDTVKNHTLDNIFFSKDLFSDAICILDAIDGIFPIREGFHVFGPMMHITWGGARTIVDLHIGVFVEIGGPGRIAIVGLACSILPTPETKLLILNMDLFGFIDLGKKTVAIDAALYDSRLLEFPLTGKAAMRIGYGASKYFVMAVDFHPRYQHKLTGLNLERIKITMGKNPRIVQFCYFAITTNTIQFGCGFELWARKKGATIKGGAEFHCLIIFNPFGFVVLMYLWVSIKIWKFKLSVDLELEIAGPNPIRIKGYVKFKVGWKKVKIRFTKTIGEKKSQPLPVISPVARLRAILQDRSVVRLQEPVQRFGSLVFTDEASDRVDPDADIVILQSEIPLNYHIRRFGGGVPPAGEEEISLEVNWPPEQVIPERTDMGIEQFNDWSEEKRLSAKPYELLQGGVRIRPIFLSEMPTAAREIEYETFLRESKAYVDLTASPSVRCLKRLVASEFSEAQFAAWRSTGAQARYGEVSKDLDSDNRNFVEINESRFAVASDETVDGDLIAVNSGVLNNGMTLSEAVGEVYDSGEEDLQLLDMMDVTI